MDKQIDKAAKLEGKDADSATEMTPLNSPAAAKRNASYDTKSDDEDFDSILSDEIRNINYFFTNKLSELRTDLEELMAGFRSSKASHHTSDVSTDAINKLRQIYIQLCALKEYATLNRTGMSLD
jgi:SPX domain protein involved in polyphosphate accumulation